MHKVAFVLFHTGETRALLPTIRTFIENTAEYEVVIIPVGQSANNNLPTELRRYIRVPQFIADGLGQNNEYQIPSDPAHIHEVLEYCKDTQSVILGVPAKIQEQIARALPRDKHCIVYFDMGCNVEKLNAFLHDTDAFIFTTHAAAESARQLVVQGAGIKKPIVLSGRHGDFDTWRTQYELNSTHLEETRAVLRVLPSDKILMWAGGYGDFSPTDVEKLAFQKFIEAYIPYKDSYHLRITIHPGLKSYPEEVCSKILENYYINQLIAQGCAREEALQMITQLSSLSVASIAHAVISLGSTVGPQSIFIGARAKNVYLKESVSNITGIETVDTPDRWRVLLQKWASKTRRSLDGASIVKANNKLGLPSESTEQALVQCLSMLEQKAVIRVSDVQDSMFDSDSADVKIHGVTNQMTKKL